MVWCCIMWINQSLLSYFGFFSSIVSRATVNILIAKSLPLIFSLQENIGRDCRVSSFRPLDIYYKTSLQKGCANLCSYWPLFVNQKYIMESS